MAADRPPRRGSSLNHFRVGSRIASPAWRRGLSATRIAFPPLPNRCETSAVGKTIQDCYGMAKNNTLEIIGIIRAGEIILPTRDTVLRENDRLLIIGSTQARESISQHLSPLAPVESQQART